MSLLTATNYGAIYSAPAKSECIDQMTELREIGIDYLIDGVLWGRTVDYAGHVVTGHFTRDRVTD
jgi:hypothetical protein